MSFVAQHRTVSRAMHVAAPPEEVFPLLCPVREREWVEGWQADVLHSRSGLAELGCVFVTQPAAGRRATYVVTRYEPAKVISFAIFHGDIAETLTVELSAVRGGTELLWARAYTGLDPAGNEWIAANIPDKIDARLASLEGMLRRYLER